MKLPVVNCPDKMLLLDPEDWEKARHHRWHRTGTRIVNDEFVALETVLELKGLRPGRDPFDWRRENLVPVEKRPKPSRYKGVYRYKDGRRWIARATLGGRTVTRGPFETEEEAAKVRVQLVQELKGATSS